MIVILGLILVLAAAGVATAGVATNSGSAHSLGDSFAIFGLSPSGLSTGQLFLFGIVVGVVGMLGLAMLFGTFNRRLASRGSRRELKGSRREGAALRVDRDRLTQELDDVRRENSHVDVTHPDRSPATVDAVQTTGTDRDAVGAAGGSDDRSAVQEPGRAQRSGLWHRFDRAGR
jgi:hypothetical protein